MMHNLLKLFFQVKYAPKVRVDIIEGALDTGRIPIDNTVRLRCETDANPNEITYQWYINDEMIPDAIYIELVSSKSHISFFSLLNSNATNKMYE